MENDAPARARAVLDGFLASFTAADPEGLAGAFWPDALVWGTTMRELADGPDAVRRYFAPLGDRRAGERRAVWEGGSVLVLSEAAVLISGTWRVAADGDAAAEPASYRLSAAVTRRGDTWRFAQFHNSPRPAPP